MAFTKENALEILRAAHERNRLAHAYLISGPPESGKRALAADLASIVNGTKPDAVFSTQAREIFVAEPESKSRRIVIEQVRQLEHALQMRAAGGQRKVAIILEADRLQPQAANAFLKTLEEPPENSLLLLLSTLPEALPDTIISRCVPITLAPASSNGSRQKYDVDLVESLGNLAREKNWNVQNAYRLAQNLQRILSSIREEIRDGTTEALKREEAQYKNATDGSWLEEREDYYKALTESRYLERRARLIETLFVFWSDVLRAKTNVKPRDLSQLKKETANVAARFSIAEILKRIRRLEVMRDHLSRNIQEALAVEVAFLSVFAN
jgi:DNA polymerase III subunit delta'